MRDHRRVATFEFTFVYPDRDFEESRRFLASVLSSRPSGLHGARRHGNGTALTVVVDTEAPAGRELAEQLARQRVAGIWPAFRPAQVVVEDGVV